MNKQIRWNPEKAELLRQDETRGGYSFEDCVIALEGDGLLEVIANPSTNHPDQKCFVLVIDGYVFLVPFVENEEEIFLKTMMPSRKLTKRYLGNLN